MDFVLQTPLPSGATAYAIYLMNGGLYTQEFVPPAGARPKQLLTSNVTALEFAGNSEWSRIRVRHVDDEFSERIRHRHAQSGHSHGGIAMTPPPASRSGQILMIAVMVLLILLVSVPAIIFMNQHATLHGVSSQRRLQGRTIAEAGVANAIQQLTTNVTTFGWPWPPAQAQLNTLGFNGLTNFQSSQGGGYYTITCTPGPVPGLLLPYQLEIAGSAREVSQEYLRSHTRKFDIGHREPAYGRRQTGHRSGLLSRPGYGSSPRGRPYGDSECTGHSVYRYGRSHPTPL